MYRFNADAIAFSAFLLGENLCQYYIKRFEIMNDKLQPVLVLIATFGMIVFNYFASTGILGGVTPNVVTDKYSMQITPAGYAFAPIWSLIYLGCIAFSIYQLLPSNLE